MILILYLFFKIYFTIVKLLSNRFRFLNDIVIIFFIAISIEIIFFSNFRRISFFSRFYLFWSFLISNSFWQYVSFHYNWSNVFRSSFFFWSGRNSACESRETRMKSMIDWITLTAESHSKLHRFSFRYERRCFLLYLHLSRFDIVMFWSWCFQRLFIFRSFFSPQRSDHTDQWRYYISLINVFDK